MGVAYSFSPTFNPQGVLRRVRVQVLARHPEIVPVLLISQVSRASNVHPVSLVPRASSVPPVVQRVMRASLAREGVLIPRQVSPRLATARTVSVVPADASATLDGQLVLTEQPVRPVLQVST